MQFGRISIESRKKKILVPSGRVVRPEVGRQTVNWDMLGQTTFNPDDVGIATYKMMMKDAEIRAGYNLIKFATLSRDWKVIMSEDSENSKEIVRNLRYIFDHMDGRLEGGLSNILLAIVHGFSVTEIVFKIIVEDEFKGKIGIKKLKGLDPEQIIFITDEFGNLKKVQQDPGLMNGTKIDLPIEKLIIYTNEKEFGNYYGTSRLRSIYKNWFIKDIVTKFWNIALERFGMPILLGKVPSPKDLTEMTNVLENAQARSSISTVEGWEISAMETGIGRSSGGDYLSCLDYHNGQIVKGLLIPGGLMGGEKGGSFAKSKISFDIFKLMLKSLETDLCSMVEQYIIKPIVNMNYGEQKEYPQFVFEPLTKAEFLDLAKVFALLVRNGVVGPDEDWIRDMMRVPKRSETSIGRNTRKLKTGEEKQKNPPPETKIIKTDKTKKPLTGKTQQIKTPQPQRSGTV